MIDILLVSILECAMALGVIAGIWLIVYGINWLLEKYYDQTLNMF